MYANLFKRQITFACVPVILGDISWPDIQNDVYQNCEKRTFRPNILYDKFSTVAIFFYLMCLFGTIVIIILTYIIL